MNRKSRSYQSLLCLVMATVLTPAAVTASSPKADESPGQGLQRLFHDYLEQRFALDPYYATTQRDRRFNRHFANTWSSAWIESAIELERQFLHAALAIPPQNLSQRDDIDRRVFIYTRRKYLAYYQFPNQLLPVNPVSSRLNNFARMGSGNYYFLFETVEDYDNWLARVAAALPWFEQLIRNFQEGLDTGIVYPKVVAERLLPQFEAHIVADEEDSLYYRPVANMPAEFSAADRQRIEQAFRRMIRHDLIPSYRRLSSFFRETYLPAARSSTAWSELPEGRAWYHQLIRYYTSTELSADQIHRLGLEQLSEIERALKAQRGKMRRQAQTPGAMLSADNDQYYQNAEQLLDAYRALAVRAEALVPRLFNILPTTPLEIKPVEAFRAASAARASYRRPPADLSGPGIVYVNTRNLNQQPKRDVETLFLHEAIPGHHFQMALTLEMDELPRVRRSQTEVAFKEGWAVYAQGLGAELGFYREPGAMFGYLSSMQFRAARLVVDTGLHTHGWSRDRAISYLAAHSNLSPTLVEKEVDRYISRPGQALAYMIGYLQILELRRHAESTLGGAFDPREFHRAVLEDGALPLSVLKEKITFWISVQNSMLLPGSVPSG